MKALKVLILLLVVCCLAYSGLWFYQAFRIEQALRQDLASVGRVSYDAIERKGFPFSIKLELVNPKITGASDLFDYRLDGKMVGSFSLSGRLKTWELIGKSHLLFPDSNMQGSREWLIEGNARADIDQKWFFGDEGTLKLSDLKITSFEKENQEPYAWLVDSGLLHYQIEKPSKERQTLLLDAKLAGVDFVQTEKESPASSFKDLYNAIEGILSEKTGKSDYAFKMKLDLPSSEALEQISSSPLLLLTQAIPTFSIDIEKAAMSNKLQKFDWSANLHLAEDAMNAIKFSLGSRASNKYEPGYTYALIAALDKLHQLAASWHASEDYQDLKELFVKYVDDLKALVPKLYEFGTIEFDTENDFEINKLGFNWKLLLSRLNLSCDLYGLRIHGAATHSDAKTVGDLVLDIKNASPLIHDICNYANRWMAVANLLVKDKQKAYRPLSQDGINKILAFLTEISTKQAVPSNDLVIRLSYEDEAIKVGSLTFDDFRMKFDALGNEIVQEVQPMLPEPPKIELPAVPK